MKINLIQFLLILVSLAIVTERDLYASSFLECEVEAIVLEVLDINEATDNNALVRADILKTQNIDGSDNDDCSFKNQKQNILITTKKGELLPNISNGKFLKIKYMYFSAMGENGPIDGETWTLIQVPE